MEGKAETMIRRDARNSGWWGTIILITALSGFYVLTGYAVREKRADAGEWLDPDNFARISRNLCQRHEFSEIPGRPTVSRGPAYPGALALPCLATGGDPVRFAPVVNGICHMATLGILCLHPLLWRRRVRHLALLFVGLDPLLLNYAGRTYLEPMLILTVGATIIGIDRLARIPNASNMAILGVAWGLSLLVKPILLYLGLFLVPCMFLFRRRCTKYSLGASLLALVIIAPWSIRNMGVAGQFIPVSSGSWEIVLKGDTFSEAIFKKDGIIALEEMAMDRLSEIDRQYGIQDLPEENREPYYRKVALDRIRSSPWTFARKLATQAVSFWFLGGYRQNTLMFVALQLPLLCLMPLAFIYILREHEGTCISIGLMSCYMVVVHVASLSIARYSMPLRPWLVSIAVVFLCFRVARWKGSRRSAKAGRTFPVPGMSATWP